LEKKKILCKTVAQVFASRNEGIWLCGDTRDRQPYQYRPVCPTKFTLMVLIASILQ